MLQILSSLKKYKKKQEIAFKNHSILNKNLTWEVLKLHVPVPFDFIV